GEPLTHDRVEHGSDDTEGPGGQPEVVQHLIQDGRSRDAAIGAVERADVQLLADDLAEPGEEGAGGKGNLFEVLGGVGANSRVNGRWSVSYTEPPRLRTSDRASLRNAMKRAQRATAVSRVPVLPVASGRAPAGGSRVPPSSGHRERSPLCGST